MQIAETTGQTTRTTEDVPNANNRCHCGAEADGVDARTHSPVCSECAGLSIIADGGVRWFDLTGFQLNLLREIVQMDQPSGQTIRRRLVAQTGDEINHGKLYPNLDELVDYQLVKKGEQDRRTLYPNLDELVDYQLVEKGKQDKRTNYYELTNDGQRLVDDIADTFQQARSRPAVADGGTEVDE